MKRAWQLQEAKNKFSEVVKEALSQGPQVITRRGREVVIVLSHAEYRRLVASQKKLSDFFRQSPLSGLDLDFDRDRSDARPDFVL